MTLPTAGRPRGLIEAEAALAMCSGELDRSLHYRRVKPIRRNAAPRSLLDGLVEEVLARSPSAGQYFHGESHWRRVGRCAIKLAQEIPGVDPLVGFLFALFHDSQRVNEKEDPGHGARGPHLLANSFPTS